MRKRFGKYTSRLRLPGKKAPVKVEHAEIDKMQEIETTENMNNNTPVTPVKTTKEVIDGGGIKTGG